MSTIDSVIEDILDSVRLAMQGQGIEADKVQQVVAEVSDYIGSHYDNEEDCGGTVPEPDNSPEAVAARQRMFKSFGW
jgi:hypothetical protein